MAPPQLASELVEKLRSFAAENDLAELYRAYDWGEDGHAAGFPRILELEAQLTTSGRTTGVTIEEVKAVTRWGRLPNPGRVRGPAICLAVQELYAGEGRPAQALTDEPERPIHALSRIKGIGPTYASKVLRFAMPSFYGAIDSRCVRTFGKGEAGEARGWIPLIAKRSGDRWCIPEGQPDWPFGYGVWIHILRYLAGTQPPNCPHPPDFTQRGLRQAGIWTTADVEMALFAYASRRLDAASASGHEVNQVPGRRIAEALPDHQIPTAVGGWRTATTRGGTKAQRFRWRYSREDDAILVVNEKGREHCFTVDEVLRVLSDLQGQFGSGFLPLANNVQTMADGTERAGLGMTILRGAPGDVTHAQGASYLGVILEEMGCLVWNGKSKGIEWRLTGQDLERETLIRRALVEGRSP